MPKTKEKKLVENVFTTYLEDRREKKERQYTSLREQVVELTITSILRTNSISSFKEYFNYEFIWGHGKLLLPECRPVRDQVVFHLFVRRL